MTITYYPELEQGSDEWLAARCGIVTASVVGRLITPTLKVANNDVSRGLTTSLVAERITGYVEPTYVSDDMYRGRLEEPLARAAYAELMGVAVAEVGFITRTVGNGVVGCSPDGLVGEEGGIEAKSRRQKKQLATILADQIPAENMAQVQCCLFVTGRKWWDYVSYGGGMPLWVKRVTPDPKWFEAITGAVEQFEQTAAEMTERYAAAVEGLPVMERTPDPYDVELKL